MKKLIVSIPVLCLFHLLASFTNVSQAPAKSTVHYRINHSITTNGTDLYNSLQLQQMGLSPDAFEKAYKGFQKLLAANKIGKKEYLTICDFSQSSRKKRLYVIDLEKNIVVMNTYVAHGRNSGTEYASKFSNKPSSLQSSLGFFITRNTYTGQHGLSLRMEGLEAGINDKAYKRAIVVHGADYIGNKRLDNNAYMGRSFGCPAVPRQESTILINTIKDGTCLFIYHPAKKYLLGSKILNG